MEEEHKKAIQRNFTSLVERTDLDMMVSALYEKGVFSERMIEPYQRTNEAIRDRKRLLYRNITRRGPNAFRHLVDSLLELGYWDIVRDLDPESPLATFPKPPMSSKLKSKRDPKLQANEESEYVSISNARIRTQNELQKNAAATAAPAPTPPPPDSENAAAVSVDIPQFNVIKSTSFFEDDSNSDLKLYHTRGHNRGVLMMFSYINFKDDMEENRGGVERDIANLKYLFSQIGLRPFSYVDLTKQETMNTLSSLEPVLKDAETVFVVVSSHGYERSGSSDIDIRCSDGKLISFLEIMSYFSNSSLPKLIGIPKVFIFQTCRGSNRDYVWGDPSLSVPPRPLGRARTDGRPARPAAPHAAPLPPAALPVQEIPLYSDILIANSTLPGQVSYRDKGEGSWFIQALCEVFAARAHNTHVDKLFALVDQHMRRRFLRQASSVDRWSFNRRLYLHPGLFQ